MVKLNRIYTRTGDAGDTGLVDGSRLSKANPRLAAMGDVDEANSCIGVAIVALGDHPIARDLALVQNELFDLGADLATPGEDFTPSDMVLRVVPAQVERLERALDALNEELAPLTSFILPGGGAGAAALHVARAVTRRAERSVVALMESGGAAANPQALAYINRLSDYLFVAARVANGAAGDILWKPGATR